MRDSYGCGDRNRGREEANQEKGCDAKVDNGGRHGHRAVHRVAEPVVSEDTAKAELECCGCRKNGPGEEGE